MKRKASRAAPYETPAKLSKRSTTVTVSRKLSTIRRTVTTPRAPMPPPKWPSMRSKPSASSLPPPAWPALVPTGRDKTGTTTPSAMTEISEEPMSPTPGLRRMSTLPLEEKEDGSSSKKGSKALSKAGSKASSASTGVAVVATLEKKGSVSVLDTSGTVTTVTRLASGSSVGETTAMSAVPPSVRKELSKAASTAADKGAPVKRLSSIRVYGVDVAEEEPSASLSRSSSKAKRDGSVRKEASLTSAASTSSPPAVPLPPGGLIEIVFSFDTTGSMSSCIGEVRGRVGDMIQRLQADIPGIRISVIAHGDYCDEDTYVIKWIDFGSSLPELCDFVQNVSSTGGGDYEECYELVLARAQTELSWTAGSQRALVMIGDAIPHPPNYYSGKDEKLDWKKETQKLADMDVKIYGVQAQNNKDSTSFFSTLAAITKGRHLKLNQFSNMFDIIMAICYNERGTEYVQAYEEEVRAREGGGLHKDLEGLFSAFRAGTATSSSALPTLSKGASKVLAKGAAKTKPSTPSKRIKSPAAKGKAAVSKAKAKGKTSVAAKGKGKAKKSAKTAARMAKGKGVKAVKGRKSTKATGKKGTKASATKKAKKPVPGVKRKFREVVKDEELSNGSCVKKIKWTPWYKAIVSTKPKGKDSVLFKNRNPARLSLGSPSSKKQVLRAGLRNVSLLKDHQNVPAIFEVAVQLKPGKRYVLFFKACSSWRRKVHWDTVLLHTPDVRREIDAVLTHSGGQIWLRRGNVKTFDDLKAAAQHITKHFDYAWSVPPTGRRGHRRVRKCSTLISGNK